MTRYSKAALWCIKRRYALLFLFALAIVLFPSLHAFAANGSDTIAEAGTGLGGDFDTNLKTLATGTVKAMHALLVVMTAIAGMMIVFGLEDGKKFIWQMLLGAGLALNFGAFMMDAGLWGMADQAAQSTAIAAFTPKIVEGEGAVNNMSLLGDFVKYFKDIVITPGAANITPYCLRLLIILTVLQASWDLTLKMMSGDKLQYLINITLKTGFFMFLMLHWIPFMKSLMEGFQTLGMRAGGSDLDGAADIVSIAGDGIAQTCFRIVGSILAPQQHATDIFTFAKMSFFAQFSPTTKLIGIVVVIALVICFFMIVLEITMAYIEFYTMALLTIPCLSFGTMGKFSFLTEKAIGCMFNCAMKVCVIGFLARFSQIYLEGLETKIAEAAANGEIGDSLALQLQVVLASFLIFMLVKKIPQLVSGLMNGSPQLSGSDMTGTIKSAGNAAVNTAGTLAGGVGAVRAASAAAAVAGKAGMKGTLTQLARNSAMSSSPVQRYRRGISNFRNTKDYTGSYELSQIRKGIKKQEEHKPQSAPPPQADQKSDRTDDE